MATRVSDTELAARLRQRNRVNSERRRERLAAGGMVQLLTWIPATLRRELDSAAAARGEPLSATTAALLAAALKTTTPAGNATAERLLLAGLDATTRDKPAATTPEADLFEAPATRDNPPVCTVVDDKAELMNQVAALLAEGLSGADIARRLAAAGYRSPNGAALTGGNLLRDYRAWLKKAGAAVAPRV